VYYFIVEAAEKIELCRVAKKQKRYTNLKDERPSDSIIHGWIYCFGFIVRHKAFNKSFRRGLHCLVEGAGLCSDKGRLLTPFIELLGV
jgi:hypothetical protein